MNFKTIFLFFSFGFLLTSCGERSDTQIQLDITRKMAATEGASINSTVNNGVVTLSGECKDQACIEEAEKNALEVSGVKSVVNNVKIAGNAEIDRAGQFAGDELLNKAVNEVIAGYEKVSVEINEGIVVLKGKIKRSEPQELMQKLHALKPKRIDNQLVIE